MTDQLREKLLAMRCLTCGHKHGWHSDDGDRCFQFTTSNATIKCNCTKFVPSDNLTWMEYIAEKRGLA